MVGAQSGLGYMIQINRLTLNTENVISGMILIGIIGAAMNYGIRIIEVKSMPWRQGY
jgi:NitT/TauT family transport system permease protein